MSRVEIRKFNNYDKVIILDKKSSDNENIYGGFIDVLKETNIISTDFNRMKFLVDNVCIIYNINKEEQMYQNIINFKKAYQYKCDKHNINIILLTKDEPIIYEIDNILICHSYLIKRLISLNQFQDVFEKFVSNDKFMNNINYYVNEMIREVIININKEGKLSGKCFKIEDKIKWFIEKESEHKNKNNSISYLDKTVVILDYKNSNKMFNVEQNHFTKIYNIN